MTGWLVGAGERGCNMALREVTGVTTQGMTFKCVQVLKRM